MSGNIGSFLIVGILLGIFVKYMTQKNGAIKLNRKNILFLKLFSFYVVINLFLGIGYFLKIGEREISYSDVVFFALFVVAISILWKKPVYSKIYLFLIVFVVSCLVSVCLNFLLDYNEYGIPYGQSWDSYFYGRTSFSLLKPSKNGLFHLIKIIMTFTVVLTFLLCIDKNSLKEFLKTVKFFSCIIIFLGFVEFIFKNLLHSSALNDFYAFVFGVGHSTKKGLGAYSNGIYATIGLRREQADFSSTISIAGILNLFLFSLDGKKSSLSVSLLCIVESIMSIAFTSLLYGGLYFVFLFIVVWQKNTKTKIVLSISALLLLSVGTVLVIKSSYFDRIKNSFKILFKFDETGNYDIKSENIRLYSILYNLKIWLRHPLFGIGLGASYSHGGLSSALVSIGIVGFSLYWITINTLFKNVLKRAIPVIPFLLMNVVYFFRGGIDYYYNMPMMTLFICYCFAVGKQINNKCYKAKG